MNLLPKNTIRVTVNGKKWDIPTKSSAQSAKYAMLRDGTFMRRLRVCNYRTDWRIVTEAHIKAHGGAW